MDALAANAGHGLGHAFLDQDIDEALHVINTNVVGTTHLVWHVGRSMRERGRGRILITSSIASQMPGSFQAVYNASKSYDQSFALAIRNELKDTGVTVTALLPGATDTEFFDRADATDTKLGASDSKDDPALVARQGFEGLMKGEASVFAGSVTSKLMGKLSAVLPDSIAGASHKPMTRPGSAG